VKEVDVASMDWQKGDGLLPAIVQHADTGAVLMLGFMNRQALMLTIAEGRVTFFSRRNQRLWTKGETSGYFIAVESVTADCDRDTLLVLGRPAGPVCHTGSESCFAVRAEPRPAPLSFLTHLEDIIDRRISDGSAASYTAQLVAQGMLRLAQRVGEEGLEVALAAASEDRAAVIRESADLLFHLLVLLRARGDSLATVVAELAARDSARRAPLAP
jgi:phosphoribosyl-ATP pyrophosphohydrolase/phosphoribosyl-AMP cyclohydrolase